MDIKDKIGNCVKELRIKKCITQERLAQKAGIDRTFISHVEKGNRNISIETLEKILKGLDISFHEFFKETLLMENGIKNLQINEL